MRPIPLMIAAAAVILTAGFLTFHGTVEPAGGALMLLAGLVALVLAVTEYIKAA